MTKFLTLVFLGLLSVGPLSAQCELSATVSDVTCDPGTGDIIFRLTVTGDAPTVRFTDYGLEFDLPFDESFILPGSWPDSIVFFLEGGAAPDVCRDTATVFRPANCAEGGGGHGDCSVSIEPTGTVTCGVADSLTAVSSGTPPFTYAWASGATGPTVPTLPGHNAYQVTVTDADGCTSTAYLSLDDSPFHVYVSSEGDYCLGQEPTLTAVAYGTEGPLTYAWSNGATTQSTSDITAEEYYTVTVTDQNGCSAVGFGFYHPSVFGQTLEVTGPPTTNCDGSPITLSVVDPDPDYTYQWLIGNDTIDGASIEVTAGGYYTVRGRENDNPDCVSFGHLSVVTASIAAEDLAIISTVPACDSLACFTVFNVGDFNSLFIPPLVEWSSPTGGAFTVEHGNICVTEPGVYQATVITRCDTIELFTEVKPFEPCAEVCGEVIMDADGDCLPDPVQQIWGLFLLFTNEETNLTYAVMTDGAGGFCGTLPVGGYQMSMLGAEGMTVTMDCEDQVLSMSVLPANPTAMELFVQEAGEQETTSAVLPTEVASDNLLKVYPNPSSGALTIESGNGLPLAASDVVRLYDGLGRLCDEVKGRALAAPWSPRNVRSGTYQLVVVAADGRFKGRSPVVFR